MRCYIGPSALTLTLTLALTQGRQNADLDSQRLSTLAGANTGYGHRVAIVEAGGDAHIALVRTRVVGRVEADPTESVEIRLRPCVARRLRRDTVHQQIARDVAGRHMKRSRYGDKDVRVVLTDSLAVEQSRLCIRAHFGRAGLISDPVVDRTHQRMQRLKLRVFGAQVGGKRFDAFAGQGQRRLPLEDPGRGNAIDRAEDPGPVLRVDRSRRHDDDLALVALVPHEIDTVTQTVHVRDVRLDAVDRDLPVDHRLPGARLRTQPQTLQCVRDRLIVLIVRGVANSDTHGRSQSKL